MSEPMIEKWKHDAWMGEALSRRSDMLNLESQIAAAKMEIDHLKNGMRKWETDYELKVCENKRLREALVSAIEEIHGEFCTSYAHHEICKKHQAALDGGKA